MDKTQFIFEPSAYNAKAEAVIRFNDIDILGHLNNTVYFSLFDTAKADYLEKVMGGKINWQRVESVVGTVNCTFLNPCYYGEKLHIFTRCEEMGHKTFTLRQVLVNTHTQEVKAVCTTIMVSYDPDTHRSSEVSDKFRQAVENFENRKFTIENKNA